MTPIFKVPLLAHCHSGQVAFFSKHSHPAGCSESFGVKNEGFY